MLILRVFSYSYFVKINDKRFFVYYHTPHPFTALLSIGSASAKIKAEANSHRFCSFE